MSLSHTSSTISTGTHQTHVLTTSMKFGKWKRFHQLLKCLVRGQFLRCRSYRLVNKWSLLSPQNHIQFLQRKFSLGTEQIVKFLFLQETKLHPHFQWIFLALDIKAILFDKSWQCAHSIPGGKSGATIWFYFYPGVNKKSNIWYKYGSLCEKE